jgi:hypothetical protein
MEETLELWLRNQSLDSGTEGFRFILSIERNNENSLILNLSPMNSNIGNNKIIEIAGNNIIKFD